MFYQDIYFSFLLLFRFCYVDDQLLLELLLKVGYLYLWIAFNAKKDMNYNKKTEGRRRCLNTGYRKTVHPFGNFLVVLPPSSYTKLQLGKKKFWKPSASNVVCGVRGGAGYV